MPELATFSVNPIEYQDADGNRLDQPRYVYKPYPKMLYRADGATKIVSDAIEHGKSFRLKKSKVMFANGKSNIYLAGIPDALLGGNV